jgi:LysM repeat protein
VTRRSIAHGLLTSLLLLGLSLAASAAPTPPTVSISSPAADAVITGDSQDISVAFKAADGAEVAYVELYVDGSLHTAKRLSPAQALGTCALSWAASQFVNGERALVVIAHDTAGASAESSIKVRLERPGGPEQPRPSVTITSPRDGATVAGKVPVNMEADAPGGIRYVMLFIDEVFTCFTNLPPFSYLWNTARWENGSHVLQARALDGAERGATSEKITVQVNNPGGRTTMEAEAAPPEPVAEPTPEAPSPPAAEAEVSGPSVSVAEPASPAALTEADVQAPRPRPAREEAVRIAQLPGSAAAAATPKPRPEPAGARTEPATGPARPVQIAQAPPMAGRTAAAAPVSAGPPRAPGPRPAQAAQPAGLRVEPQAKLAAPVMIAQAPPMARERGAPAPARIATPATQPAGKPTVIAKAPTPVREVALVEQGPAGVVLHTVRPGQELGRIASAYGVSVEALAAENGLPEGASLTTGASLRVPVARGELYLDGVRLATNTPTVFVGGIAAGPFRHIVEGSGGIVVWEPSDHSIGARAFDHTMRLWVGKAEAQVDGRNVAMDLATFVEEGRAMVPLRFFRDALGYIVNYDRDTGRIYIAKR